MADLVVEDQRSRLRAEVAVGRDGYLFYRGDDSFAQVCDASTLDDGDARRLVGRLQGRFDWCGRRGIDYFLLIVPEKQVVYADKLPPGMVISLRRPAARVMTLMSGAVRSNVLYPESELRAGRGLLPTYFRTDSHWSRWGAYLGYRSLVERVNQRFAGRAGVVTRPAVAEADLVMSEDALVGDLGVRLDDEPVEAFTWVRPRGALRFRKRTLNRTFSAGQVDVFEHDDAALPRAVMFRSSNGTHLVDPFLAGHFSRLVVVTGTHSVFGDLVEAERPDCVISEVPERYLAVRADGGIRLPVAFGAVGFCAETGLGLRLPGGVERG